MKNYLIILFLLLAGPIFAQTQTITGKMVDEEGNPLPSATAVLLDPADSTLAFFGISDADGYYAIKDAKQGSYILQFAYIGHETKYYHISIPLENNGQRGVEALAPRSVDVDEVKVTAEYIPIQIRRDTLEFNAKAFKNKPDAVVEDLLKKLPGIEVGRDGSITALGEPVGKVLVDGKEFFGNDPKVATKNLPADAIDKVQVIDKKSDEAEFTGIDDGSRSKAINLVLDEDKKKGVMGNISAGAGTNQRYQFNSRLYNFSDKFQIAGLGRINNLNQSGFSLDDFVIRGGGMAITVGGLSGGGGGLSTAGSGGMNFSYSKDNFNTVYMSYTGTGNKTLLEQSTYSRNYTNDIEFIEDEELERETKNFSHRINMGIKRRIDSTMNLNLNANINFNTMDQNGNSLTDRLQDAGLVNRLDNHTWQASEGLSADYKANYTRMINGQNTVLSLGSSGGLDINTGDLTWTNITSYFNPANEVTVSQYQDSRTDNLNVSLFANLSQRISNKWFIIPEVSATYRENALDREQGLPGPPEFVYDSLSPQFSKKYLAAKPKLTFKRTTKKARLDLNLLAEISRLAIELEGEELRNTNYAYLLPSISFEYEYLTGKRINLDYRSSLNTPSVTQLMPVVNNLNPLSLSTGNPDLKPEYKHSLFFHWMFFDKFSFTNFFLGANAGYTQNKINWSRTINDQLEQTAQPVNVDWNYDAALYSNFSTPIRKVGMKINLGWNESWNRGLSYINDEENIYSSLTHSFRLSFDNRKKEKWDFNIGGSVAYTQSSYSLQESLNNDYYNLGYFADLRFTPNDTWNFEVTGDVTNYNSQSFDESVNIPLVGAEIAYFFLSGKRASIKLSAVDLLNQNKGLKRISDLNYLMEQRSNVLGRYVMCTFTYRLNQFGGGAKAGGVHVKVLK